jgi:hypothetical protein
MAREQQHKNDPAPRPTPQRRYRKYNINLFI